MDQTIIMKQPVKSDEKWENGPHMMAARYLIVFLLLFFPGQTLLSGVALLFFSDFMPVISVVRWIYQLLLVVGLIWIVVKKNKECNLTKSTAFIKRGSTLYMIEMGYYTTKDMYLEEGEEVTPMPDREPSLREAAYIQDLETRTREARKKPELFVQALDTYLDTRRLLSYIGCITTMERARIEKETDRYVWIGYEEKGQSKSKKIRKVYDFSCLK